MSHDWTPDSDVAQRLTETEDALRRSEARLALALEAARGVGAWDWDVAEDRVFANAEFARLFGLDPADAEAGAPLGAFLRGVHPDDRDRVTAEIDAALRDQGDFVSEYRLGQAAAGTMWVQARGRVERDDAGRPTRFAGVVVDVTERRMALDALRDSEARFRAIADSMPQMVWSTLPDGFHDYYNARWYEFTGVPAGSTDGEGWNDMFHPDDQARAWARWRRSLDTGEPYEIEYRLRHRSGDYRWTLGRALPIRDAEGRITRWFGTCTDIDAAKRDAEQAELLSHELSHRIKNIFAVVSGLIGLSARQFPEAREFAAALKERIAALGRAHDFARPHSELSRPVGLDTTIGGMVKELLAPYPAMSEGRIRVSGDEVQADDRAATPLALVFHELATNASKYGALACPDGRVDVTTRVDQGRCRIVWSESGGPPLAGPPGRLGFGTRLSDVSVENQLSGRIIRSWKAEGLHVELDVPVANLTRSPRG